MITLVKICGLTTPEDTCAAVDAGADLIGLNFSAQSVRRVTLDQARSLIEVVPDFGHRFAGVFVEQTWDEIAAINAECNLSFFQSYTAPWPVERATVAFHIVAFRVRSAEDIAGIHNVLRSLRERTLVNKVVPPVVGESNRSRSERSTLDLIRSRSERSTPFEPDFLLIDSFVPGAMGGTGHKAPWDLLAGQDFGVPLILAGGLTPENVAEAIRIVRPHGVDVASGVESSPGRKDAGKMRAFVQAARDAGAAL